MSKLLYALCLVISGLILSGCFGSSASIPEDQYYRLPDINTKALAQPIIDGTLSIKRIQTDGIYSERSILYTNNETSLKLQRYHYHHWEKTPAQLLQENLFNYFNTTGVAQKTVKHGTTTSIDYILTGELIRFERLIGSNNHSAIISVEFRLTDKTQNHIYLQKRYTKKVTAQSDDLYSTIVSFGGALEYIYQELTSDLKSIQL